jgi:glycosyltransferase involved in cell wall biosynthesis
MPQITATIITFNEENRIGEAIASLACCDEIIVVDSCSTDHTREIAARLGATVLTREWEGYSRQKNFAAAQAHNDWILSVDADERLSAELCSEIAEFKRHDSVFAAMSMPRRAFYLGRWIRHSGWYPDRKVRLYDRRRTRWHGDFVHEAMQVDGPLGLLHGDLLHFPYRNLQEHSDRIDHYTRLAADAFRKSGKRGSLMKLLLAPPAFFLKTFLLQAGILDGWRGLVIASMGARYVFLREYRKFRDRKSLEIRTS